MKPSSANVTGTARAGRRHVLTGALGLASAASLMPARQAGAQAVPSPSAYPVKPVRVLVPYSAGGSADNAARLMAEKLAAALGQNFVIDNRPGASGTIAAQALAAAPGDGYTLMVAPTAVAAITPVTRKTPYDPLKDFTAVAKLSGSLGMLSVSPAIPAKTWPELLKLARENPGKLAFGSSGVGTITHLTGEVLQQAAGIKLLHVPYKSIVDGVGDLLSGRVAMVFDPFILPQVRAGKVFAVAALGGRRHPEFPDVPTIEERGIDMQGFFARSWFGMFGPRDMPREVVEKLNAEIEKAGRDPELVRKMQGLGLYPDFVPSARFTAQLNSDLAFFAALLKQLDIRLES